MGELFSDPLESRLLSVCLALCYWSIDVLIDAKNLVLSNFPIGLVEREQRKWCPLALVAGNFVPLVMKP